MDGLATSALSIFTEVGGEPLNLNSGEMIYDHDTPAVNVFFINRGQVRLYMVDDNGATRLAQILGAGQWCGAAAFAGLATQEIRAVAVGATALTQINSTQLLAALANNPTQLLELNRQLAAKLIAAHREASRFVFEDCNTRLVNALLRFSHSAASSPRDDGVVLRITHDQLAQAVGVARETVSLALTQLRLQNLLRTGRNQLMFNPETLRKFSRSQSESRMAHAVVESVA